MTVNFLEQVSQESHDILTQWLHTCTRHGKIARNTVAVGIVVLDHLKRKSPVRRENVISNGGEVMGARSGLGHLLEEYGIPNRYLKEVTTRQAHQDGQRLFEQFAWGNHLAHLSVEERTRVLLELIDRLRGLAQEWLKQQSLKPDLDRRWSPATWIQAIIQNAQGRSGGVVEQHLVGAKLARRFKQISLPNYPAHAGDKQTDRQGDFTIEKFVYHVTSAPSRAVLRKCAQNIRDGLRPILLMPQQQRNRAQILAQDERVDEGLTIISIEDFVALNIIELAVGDNKDAFTILRELVAIYNQRLAEVETDLSLQIEV